MQAVIDDSCSVSSCATVGDMQRLEGAALNPVGQCTVIEGTYCVYMRADEIVK